MNELDARLAKLEKELKDSKEGTLERWGKSFILPVSLAFCGYFFSSALKEAEIQSTGRIATAKVETDVQIAAREEAVANIHARVGQAQTVSTLMRSLLSSNPVEQKLAIEAVLIALKDDGPRLVGVLSQVETNERVKAFASRAYDEHAEALIQDVIGNDPWRSSQAAQTFARGYGGDVEQVGKLLDAAESKGASSNAIESTLNALPRVDTRVLQANTAKFEQFVRKVDTNRPQSNARVDQLKRKL